MICIHNPVSNVFRIITDTAKVHIFELKENISLNIA